MSMWNGNDTQSGMIISADGLTATWPDSTWGSVRGNKSVVSGKHQAEFTIGSFDYGTWFVGVADLSYPLGSPGPSAAGACVYGPNGTVWNGTQGQTGSTFNGGIVTLLLDADAKTIMFLLNGGNPRGPYDISALAAFFPVFSGSSVGASCLASFDASAFAYPQAGYSAWPAEDAPPPPPGVVYGPGRAFLTGQSEIVFDITPRVGFDDFEFIFRGINQPSNTIAGLLCAVCSDDGVTFDTSPHYSIIGFTFYKPVNLHFLPGYNPAQLEEYGMLTLPDASHQHIRWPISTDVGFDPYHGYHGRMVVTNPVSGSWGSGHQTCPYYLSEGHFRCGNGLPEPNRYQGFWAKNGNPDVSPGGPGVPIKLIKFFFPGDASTSFTNKLLCSGCIDMMPIPNPAS